MLQVALFLYSGSKITIYHPEGCSATGCTNELSNTQTPNDCGGLGMGSIDLLIVKTEIVYIKISPSGALTGNQYYDLAVRAYNLTELRPGDSFTSTPGNNSIHGWAI